MRTANAQLEAERQKLREELTKCESRSARLEIQRIALEGDLNRLQMILQEKDVQLQVNFDEVISLLRLFSIIFF